MDPVSIRARVLDDSGTDELRAWADAIQMWPAGSHIWGHYAEVTAHGPAICRTENVSACHAGVEALVAGRLQELAERARLGEPVVAFKDKINYKQPGGAGFGAHQDRLAYPGVDRVLSVLVAIDACSLESGCLWIAPEVDRVLPVDERGVVRADAQSEVEWTAAELEPGEAVFIDGLAAHYSEANRSSAQRRVLVASYAPVSEGYSRARYYEARAVRMDDATARDGRFRISTLADFEGAEVAPVHPATDDCTHG